MQQAILWIRKNVFNVAAAALLLFVLFIAITWQWENDEAWTYFGIEGDSFSNIVNYANFKYANNHAINSSWFHFLQLSGIKSLICYRLLSIGSFCLYAVYIRKLLKLSAPDITRNLLSIVSLLLPFVLYFSLGRGYAMGLAFFTVALYYYRIYQQEDKMLYVFLFIITGSVSAVSVFSFIYPFLAMLTLLVVKTLLNIKSQRVVKTKPLLHLFVAGVLTIPVVLYVFQKGAIINSYDKGIIGADSLFVDGTISSIISFLGLDTVIAPRYALYLKIAIVVTMIPALVILLLRRIIYDELIILLLIFFLFFVSHVFFGAKYPLLRGISYIPILLYLVFLYSLNEKKQVFISLHLCVILVVSCFNMAIMARAATKGKLGDVVNYMADKKATLVVNTIHSKNVNIYNHLYHKDSVSIYNCKDSADFIEQAKTAEYMLVNFNHYGFETDKHFRLISKTHDYGLYVRKK